MVIEKLHGLIAAPFTPMNEDGSLNLSLILIRNTGFAVMPLKTGATGEDEMAVIFSACFWLVCE